MVTMNISLTPELAKIVNKRVKSGMFGSVSEYFRNTIRTSENLRFIEEVQKGLDQANKGEFADYDYDSFMKEMDEKL